MKSSKWWRPLMMKALAPPSPPTFFCSFLLCLCVGTVNNSREKEQIRIRDNTQGSVRQQQQQKDSPRENKRRGGHSIQIQIHLISWGEKPVSEMHSADAWRQGNNKSTGVPTKQEQKRAEEESAAKGKVILFWLWFRVRNNNNSNKKGEDKNSNDKLPPLYC